eukprot:GILJ01003000.1.p1 GENE.GILJ01003000.1~~GILJ01003000.1.p1  ORF type:complete len:385 (-),score=31.19 GILJ01003000.1:555-1709(-)
MSASDFLKALLDLHVNWLLLVIVVFVGLFLYLDTSGDKRRYRSAEGIHYQFKITPPLFLYLLRSLLNFKKSVLPTGQTVPRLKVSISCVVPDLFRAIAYRLTCGYPSTFPADHFPTGYFRIVAFPAQVVLLSCAEFPLKLRNSVHRRSVIRQYEPVLDIACYEVVCYVQGHRVNNQQLAEIDIKTEIRHAPPPPNQRDNLDRPVYQSATPAARPVLWEETLTLTYLPPSFQPDHYTADSARVEVVGKSTWKQELEVDRQTVRRFQALTMDYNPIHFHPWTAKYFGFHHTLPASMYLVTRVLAELERENQIYRALRQRPHEISTEFLVPCHAKTALVEVDIRQVNTAQTLQDNSQALCVYVTDKRTEQMLMTITFTPVANCAVEK